MKKIVAVFIVLAGFLVMEVPCFAAAGNDNYEQLNEYLQVEMEKVAIPGMAVAVVNQDEVLFSEAYGDCISTAQPFIIGSLSKSFTAVAILQLAEQGLIDLEADIFQYLPQLPAPVGVSVKQLLNQNSGMATYQRQDDLQFSGAKQFVYANANYGLLGQIIEHVSGMSYAEYIEQHIFAPLEMKNSYTDYASAKANGLIAGHRNYFGLMVEQEYAYPAADTQDVWSVSAGYLISAADDMGQYLQMYLNDGGDILQPESVARMFSDNIPTGEGGFYGMGWEIDTSNEYMLLHHSGLTENYMSHMFIFPDQKTAVIILINSNDYLVGNELAGTIGNGLRQFLLGQELSGNDSNAYFLKHAVIDVLLLLVLVLAMLPLLFYCRRKRRVTMVGTGLLFLASAFLLVLPSLIGVEWSILFAFVPDVFWVLATTIVLLLAGGILRMITLLRNRKSSAR